MKTSEIFPSNYLKAADLQGRQVQAIIEKVVMESVGDEDKPVVYFQGKNKGLVMNRTNGGSIEGMYGDDTDNWIGKPIVLYGTKVSFQGRMVDSIRIMPPQQEKFAPVAAMREQMQQKNREPGIDMDSVPF